MNKSIRKGNQRHFTHSNICIFRLVWNIPRTVLKIKRIKQIFDAFQKRYQRQYFLHRKRLVLPKMWNKKCPYQKGEKISNDVDVHYWDEVIEDETTLDESVTHYWLVCVGWFFLIWVNLKSVVGISWYIIAINHIHYSYQRWMIVHGLTRNFRIWDEDQSIHLLILMFL